MRLKFVVGTIIEIGALGLTCHGAEPPVQFVLRINLNGPTLTIDGRPWEGNGSPHLQSQDRSFENQDVPLGPPHPDPNRGRMIRSVSGAER